MNYIVSSEKAMAPHSSALAGKSHGRRSLVGCSPWGCKSRTRLRNFTFTFHFHVQEKETATHSSVTAWRIPGTGSLVGCHLWVAQFQTWLKGLSSPAAVAHWGKPRASEVTWPGFDMWLHWILALCLPPASLAFLCPTSLISKGQCY